MCEVGCAHVVNDQNSDAGENNDCFLNFRFCSEQRVFIQAFVCKCTKIQ